MVSWAEQVIDHFFADRKSPSRSECDEIAQSISGASTVTPAESPGSLSYTVVCNGCPGARQDLVVSFRELGSMFNDEMVRLAKQVHGDLVPESTYQGQVDGAEPPLCIYSMPRLRGSSCIQVLPCQVELDPNKEAQHKAFMKHLARYFAQCWFSPQSVDHQFLAEQREGIYRRLVRLMQESPPIVPIWALSELIKSLPLLFGENYPQVLTHGDFSLTNILMDEGNYEITGIVDWSRAAIMPFGLNLDILFLATGFMTPDGWHDYSCKRRLSDTFWQEFWAISEIRGEGEQSGIYHLALAASKISAILQFAFRRNADGSPSEEVLQSGAGVNQLRAWLDVQWEGLS